MTFSERHSPSTEGAVHEGKAAVETETEAAPVLSVVVPVFNQAESIVENLDVIRRRVSERLGDRIEVVVVSDGSIDATEAELRARQDGSEFRVFHYDRNLGKGYAVKLGALEARGEWVGFVDADLDLDPADLATYVRRGQEHHLDFVIGSKRHPDSEVQYPRSRVVASWLFQQVVRLLFRFDVRDTQVGLKVFRREVSEQVLPLLLVKRYAFDIELLAVARAFGFGRIEEMPVRLDYRFTGSGVRSGAVLRALIDTAAIFYRLRILRYYQRRRAIVGALGWTRPRGHQALVTVLAPPGAHFRERDYPHVEVTTVGNGSPEAIHTAAQAASGEILAILQPAALASGNWLSATVPFLARDEIVAVVTPKLAPLEGAVRARAAAAVDESRLGSGFGYFRHTPGNMRFVTDFPAVGLVVRRDSFLSLPEATPFGDLVRSLARLGRVLYTPESVIVAEPPNLFRPHLEAVWRRGRRAGASIRRGRLVVRGSALIFPVMLLAAALLLGVRLGGAGTDVALAIVLVYALAVLGVVVAASLRFHSLAVGLVAGFGILCTQTTYLAGMFRGLADW